LPTLGHNLIPRYIRKKVYQHYPKLYKQQFYQKLNDQKTENYEQKIRNRRAHFSGDINNLRYYYTGYPNMERIRREQEIKQRAEQQALNNILKIDL
jgi:hypothetical protein